jgi:hypothetical protein
MTLRERAGFLRWQPQHLAQSVLQLLRYDAGGVSRCSRMTSSMRSWSVQSRSTAWSFSALCNSGGSFRFTRTRHWVRKYLGLAGGFVTA